MSGHSKWATTKHKKAANDAKRSKLFAKLVKNVEVAARVGGGDPSGNPTLFDAIQKAKKNSVPTDNIDRAIKRGSGLEAGGAQYQSITYEGYGPGGVAILIECLTDNRNRAASDVRLALSRSGGSLADPGSVSYLFERIGSIQIPAQSTSEEEILEAVLSYEVNEIDFYDDIFDLSCAPGDLVKVREALQGANIDYDSAEIGFSASVEVELDTTGAQKMLKLIDALEDLDDVQNVYSNFTLSKQAEVELEAKA